MTQNDASPVWHPALRADDDEQVAATLSIKTSSDSPSDLPQREEYLEELPSTENESAGDAGAPASPPEKTARVEDAETITSPVLNEQPKLSETKDQATPEETQEKQSEREDVELHSTEFNDSPSAHVVEQFKPTPGEDSFPWPQGSEPAQVQGVQSHDEVFDAVHDGAQTHGDLSWMNQQGPEDNPHPVNGGTTNHDFWGSPKSVDDGEDDFFNQLKTQTKPIYMPPEAESRFEEGVPLLDDSAQTPIEPSTNQDSQINNVFDSDDDDDEDGFFAGATEKPTAPSQGTQLPLHLKRKSTSQVIDSLIAPTSPLSPSAEEFDNILAAAASDNRVSEGTVLDNNTEEPSTEEDLAARWQAELSDDDAAPDDDDDLAARWEAELDDDDILLDDEATKEAGSQEINGDAPPSLQSPFGTPQGSSRPKAQLAYTPHQPSTSDLINGVPVQGIVPAPAVPTPADYFHPHPAAPSIPATRAESFAERSKEGYKSPYDLPEDLAPRRRPVQRPLAAPPTSSIPVPPPPTGSVPAPPPPKPSSPVPTPPLGTAPPATTASPPKNFYEDLPLPAPRTHSRPTTSSRYAPNTTAPPLVPQPPMANLPVNNAPALHSSIDMVPQSQLQQPERLAPYTNSLNSSTPGAPVMPPATSRYSPRPPGLQPGAKPAASPRYSPAPPPSAAPPTLNRYASQPNLPFQPRTSSPLAYHEKASYQPQETAEQHPLRRSSAGHPPITQVQPPQPDVGLVNSFAPPSEAIDPGRFNPDAQGEVQQNPYAPQAYIDEFSRHLPQTDAPPSAYAPPSPPAAHEGSQFAPPRRSMTQSPSQQKAGPKLSVPSVEPFVRPASVHGSGSPTKTINPYAPSQTTIHNRSISQQLEFIPPTDGREHDPLERWKGSPIVKFGFGGSIVSCFPVHIPRYSAGQATPKIKSSPGELKIAQLKDWIPPQESIVQHPGPLKNKSKKKDLVAWLSSKIAAFENEGASGDIQVLPDFQKRHEEKILLWKIVRVLVEHDGALQGSPELQKSLRNVIFPHLQNLESEPSYGNNFDSFATTQSFNASSRPDANDSKSLDRIRNSLLLGDREKAVWNAVDNRLWGHAMIVASTMERSVWKQVVQEFVRREVRSATDNSESLAALYEIFAGNIEESIDELVPPSARAGLQMISKVDGHGTSKNALAGLESWRDTLGLVLGNRSPEDHQALLALGRLLLTYGRVEAAHICLIFSRAAVFGGPDDQQASLVLLGVDPRQSTPAVLQDDDAILLTEAYEYAISVLAGAPTAALPHLSAFKLIHAWSLANSGRKSEAQQYCDAIGATLKATTKPSPYHHQHLFYGIDELSASLRQTTDGSGSWISKPSMERVSSSMWNKFTNFVAGDDSDAVSVGSAKGGEGDFGPFAKISGTPTVSRSPSVTEPYGTYPAAQALSSSAPSRYQPNNPYGAISSPEQGRGRSSLDSQRSASFGLPYGQRRGSQELTTPSDNNMYQGGPFYGSPSAGYQSTPPQTSYMPLAPVEEDTPPQSFTESPAPAQGYFGGEPAYQPAAQHSFNQSLDNTPQVDEPGGYMPPMGNTGYEPPSNESPQLDVTEESDEDKPKKKSTMDDDDDDDLAARAEALKRAQKAENDRIAAEAFRKAAEADAQKDAAAAKSSWISGWFRRGNKETDNSNNKNTGGPIRAKLGEENSFYYDKELKKWVNKKDPNSATPTRATPPPPRSAAPPSRTASGSSAPPPPASGPSSRPSSAAGAPPLASSSPVPSALGVTPPTMRSVSTSAVNASRPGSSAGPPPRPATSLSNASLIDDLLGAPQARKGGGAAKKKKGRYVDVMAQ